MPEDFIQLPDGKRLIVFETDRHPDHQGTSVNMQETLGGDIPTYIVTADNVSASNNSNILSVFNNNNLGKRIRIQHVYAYSRTSANNTIVLQIVYSSTVPAGGSEAIFTRLAADFDDRPATPNTILTKIGSTTNPVANINLGGARINLNADLRNIDLFRKQSNYSSIQLRPQPNAEGIIIRQVAGGNTGTVTVHVVFTLD